MPFVDYAVAICSGSRPENSDASDAVKGMWRSERDRAVVRIGLAAKARAIVDGRTAPIVADVRAVAAPILRHAF